MDKMMSQMRNEMKQGMDAPGIKDKMSKMGAGRFAQSSMVMSTKQGANGQPVQETYKTQATGAFGGGNRVTERH